MKKLVKFYSIFIASTCLLVSSCKNDDIVLPSGPLAVGDYYEGGYVFYLDQASKSGLVCAADDQSSNSTWCNGANVILTGANGSAVGTGQTNTTAIIAAQGAGTYAAKLCDDLVLSGYSDWFLPSKDELSLMYENLHKKGIGGFTEYGFGYWSSTESNASYAYVVAFASGQQATSMKPLGTRVRAVRAIKIVTALPTITTTSISSITSNSAKSGGIITLAGTSSVTSRGICWSTRTNPTIALSTKTVDGSGIGTFTSSITGLLAGTTYYVVAYATNSSGTAYGNEVSFQTPASANLPVLTTTAISSISSTTAQGGGTITSAGSSPVTARGVCWSTSTNPTVSLSTRTSDGTGTGTFSSSIVGLTTRTKYYVRAYATSSAGTSYGNEVTFTTL